MRLFCLLVGLFAASQARYPPDRGYDPDPGYLCSPSLGIKPSIKYFFDEERNVRYPFLYLGCGGNGNRFDSSDTGIADYNPCPGFGEAHGTCGPPTGEQCPHGYSCNSGYPVSYCCNIEDEKRYNENREARCPGFSKGPQLDPEGPIWTGKHYPFFGRNCSHNFCETSATCFQGPYLAFCCLN